MKYKRTLALFLCLLLVLAAGCKENAPDASGNGQVDIRQSDGRYETQLFAMDTVMELAAYGTGARLALIEAADLIRELDALFSVTDTQSDIYRINHNAGQFTAVDERTLEVIEKSLAISRQTGGHFDITIFPVVQAWGFNTADPQVPDAAVLEGAVEKVGFEGIEIEGGRIRIAEGMGLDLGAVAKGYASQAVIDLFRQRGLESAMVSLGGNIQLLGRKPDDSPWKVGVRDPVNQNGIFCMLSLSDAAVVTSGSYIRYFTEDNVDYHHLLNPFHGYPAENGLVSVSVICSDGADADALSTALFVMGYESALDYWRENGGFEAIFVLEDMQVIYTGGLADIFTPVDDENKFTYRLASQG